MKKPGVSRARDPDGSFSPTRAHCALSACSAFRARSLRSRIPSPPTPALPCSCTAATKIPAAACGCMVLLPRSPPALLPTLPVSPPPPPSPLPLPPPPPPPPPARLLPLLPNPCANVCCRVHCLALLALLWLGSLHVCRCRYCRLPFRRCPRRCYSLSRLSRRRCRCCQIHV